MALKATVFKAQVQISDMDRHYYETHTLTLARHPSETDERMMARLLAFCLFADPGLAFTKGLCADDEPDLWQLSLSGEIERWIEVGQPDERRLRKASGRAREVVVLNYSGRAAEIWWQQNGAGLRRLRNLRVLDVDGAGTRHWRIWWSGPWTSSAASRAARFGSATAARRWNWPRPSARVEPSRSSLRFGLERHLAVPASTTGGGKPQVPRQGSTPRITLPDKPGSRPQVARNRSRC